MSRFFTRLFFAILLCISIPAGAQEEETRSRDSIPKSQTYGIRFGVDLSRLIITALDDSYEGIELVGDMRFSEKWYLATELGTESRNVVEALENFENRNVINIYDFTSSGSYIKLGVDYNTYDNWYGMNNVIYMGARYGFSTFKKDLNEYSLFDSNRYWNPDSFLPGDDFPRELSDLNASWLELLFGVKAELFANIYLGASVRLGMLISRKESEVMPHIWIPGFNRVTENSSFGVGFNYSISYLLPIYRKARKPGE